MRFIIIDSDDYYSCGMPSIASLYRYDLVLVFTLTLDAYYVFIILCLSTVQHVVDFIPWCADTLGDYYDDHAGEEILEDLQPTEEEREWRADDVE